MVLEFSLRHLAEGHARPATGQPLEHRFCYPLQLCAHLGFRLNVRRTHDYAIGTRVEQRSHDIFGRLLPIDGDGDQFRIAAGVHCQSIELLAGSFQVGRA